MRIVITFILLQILFKINSFEGENLIVTYSTSFKKYKDSQKPIKVSVKLYISDTTSVYISEDLENILKLDDGESLSYLTTTQISRAKERISEIGYFVLKNHSNGDLTLGQGISKVQFAGYKQKMMTSGDWEISQDTSTISGILCYKAESKYGGRKWVAWFSSEIPISEGPDKFSGLPGLIVKLESSDSDYQFILSGLERLKGETPRLPKYQIVEKEKFKDLRLIYYDNLIPVNSVTDITMNGKKYNRDEVVQLLKKNELNKNYVEID